MQLFCSSRWSLHKGKGRNKKVGEARGMAGLPCQRSRGAVAFAFAIWHQTGFLMVNPFISGIIWLDQKYRPGHNEFVVLWPSVALRSLLRVRPLLNFFDTPHPWQFHAIGRRNWSSAVSNGGQADSCNYFCYRGFQYYWDLDYISRNFVD